ncbi:sulfotransferase [Oceaniglobus trochenteri]|uniref:sulfotransferase n=1 Tax=Oceaniglobus trochenteri TaxID=2763260 RepID=UPI001D0014B1|nr:sulfotransferase [Oceaniglobus trochenteri]
MAAPVVMFCVGATKSGTSWLHDALARHPECHFRSVKELHYFDGLEKGKLAEQHAQMTRWRDALDQKRAATSLLRRGGLARRVQDRDDWLAVLARGQEDKAAYLDYLMKGRKSAKVVGDVTPAYALLPVERLRSMATLSEDVRFVYVLRDPVARLWSHVRMMAARRGEDGTVDPNRAKNILNRTIAGGEDEISMRGDYAGALGRLDQAVAPEKQLTVFYEDLFGGDGMARICGFLGIAPQTGEQARRVHEGSALDMPGPLRDKAREWLVPQYEDVARRMGRLPEAWQANMVRV